MNEIVSIKNGKKEADDKDSAEREEMERYKDIKIETSQSRKFNVLTSFDSLIN